MQNVAPMGGGVYLLGEKARLDTGGQAGPLRFLGAFCPYVAALFGLRVAPQVRVYVRGRVCPYDLYQLADPTRPPPPTAIQPNMLTGSRY